MAMANIPRIPPPSIHSNFIKVHLNFILLF
jgi:hypothetical protein